MFKNYSKKEYLQKSLTFMNKAYKMSFEEEEEEEEEEKSGSESEEEKSGSESEESEKIRI